MYLFVLHAGSSECGIKTQIERGFRFLKEPQFFADSFFVKKPERVETI